MKTRPQDTGTQCLTSAHRSRGKLRNSIHVWRAIPTAAPSCAGRCRPSRFIVRRNSSTIPHATSPSFRVSTPCSEAFRLIGLAGLHDASLDLPACSFSAFTRVFSGEGCFKQFKVSFPTHLSDQKPSQRDFVDVRKSFGELRNVERCRR